METLLEKLERLLKDEEDTLQRLLDKRDAIDLLIKNQQENVWKREEELEEEKQKYNYL
jgi:hypothetical protein